ncbi:hypothetical protein VPHK397_0135 [Vibrio phage K397]
MELGNVIATEFGTYLELLPWAVGGVAAVVVLLMLATSK